MNKKTIIIILLCMTLLFSSCIPLRFIKGVDADEYPDRDLPIYDDAIIYEYDEGKDEVTIKYGTEDDIDDVTEFYQDFFDDENIVLDDEDAEDDEYKAEGFFEDFLFEISAEEADGKNEEKVFETTVEVNIEFLDDDEIDKRSDTTDQEDKDGMLDDTKDNLFDNQDNQDETEVELANLTNQIILEQDGIKITTKGFEETYYSMELKMLIENTSDLKVDIDPVYVIVNGYSLQNSYIIATVDPDSKLNTELIFDLEELKMCGIEEIVDIEIVIQLTNYDTWDDISTSNVIMLKTNSTYNQVYNSTGITLVNEQGVTIVFQKYVIPDNEYTGPYFVFYIENNTNKAIDVDVDDEKVNGFMINTMMYGTIQPSTVAVVDMVFFSSDLEDNSIEEIETVEVKFKVRNESEWTYFIESDMIILPME